MDQSRNIPLVRAAVIEPVILAARAIGSPVEKLLQSEGLSVHLLDDPHMLVAELPAWQLVKKIAHMEGVTNFGVVATMELAHQDIESVKPLLEGCLNLKGLLERLVLIAPSQSSINRYELIEQDDYVWLLQKGRRLTEDYTQVELFEVAGMIQLVQLVMGESWRPPEIHFSFKYCHQVENAEQLNPGRILFSQPYPGIAIPRNLISREIPDFQNSGEADISGYLLMPESLAQQLQTAISPYIGSSKLNSKLLSDISGLSWRTLQRRLNENNTSYSEILEHARFLKAQAILKQADEKLLNISLMLGYENASSFTRAFKRWSGVTPKEYRSNYNDNYRM